MQYLTKINLKSSSILREQFAPVFEALKQVPNRDDSTEDRLAQILGDIQEGSQQAESEEGGDNDEELSDKERDIDLMAGDDDDDEEEIEPENEEDLAFLNDEVTENDPSFYRRLNLSLIHIWRCRRRG